MVKHIVMWKLKDFAEGADKAANALKMKQKLESCAHLVPGTLAFEVKLPEPGLEATYDIVLYSEFDSKESLDAYADHPLHAAIKPFIGAVRAERQCMDYHA